MPNIDKTYASVLTSRSCIPATSVLEDIERIASSASPLENREHCVLNSPSRNRGTKSYADVLKGGVFYNSESSLPKEYIKEEKFQTRVGDKESSSSSNGSSLKKNQFQIIVLQKRGK